MDYGRKLRRENELEEKNQSDVVGLLSVTGRHLVFVSAMFSRLFDFQSESGCLRVRSCYKLVIILKFELVFLLF